MNDACKPFSREVSDAELRAAYADPDNRGIIRGVLMGYRKQIPHDELESCGLHGLWQALRKHIPDHPSGQKFTTSLHRFVVWACNKELRRMRAAHRRGSPLALPETADPRHERAIRAADASFVVERLRLIPREYRIAVREYYLEGRTTEEIAYRNGWTQDAARARVHAGVCRLREVCQDPV
jgi:DNA-directed RNA polymerase specialized sigma24 family protein